MHRTQISTGIYPLFCGTLGGGGGGVWVNGGTSLIRTFLDQSVSRLVRCPD